MTLGLGDVAACAKSDILRFYIVFSMFSLCRIAKSFQKFVLGRDWRVAEAGLVGVVEIAKLEGQLARFRAARAFECCIMNLKLITDFFGGNMNCICNM